MSGKIAIVMRCTFTVIAIYLFLKNSSSTTKIISQLGTTYSNGVKTLQGR